MAARAQQPAMPVIGINVAIDSKLRGCDVLALKVEDVVPNATVRQKKTGQPVRFELSEQTREAIDEYRAGC